MIAPLPIDERLDEIVARVRETGAAVVVAPPGAGKTTRVAPRLAEEGPTILLQPRRVAARSLARRIAAERGWTVGREVGWQVRFERRFGSDTRLLVATEGVLTARLQSDPLLGDFRTVVLDEFHERSLHADLALALVREARAARGDLRVVVMSATLDARPVALYLDCPVIEVASRAHPLEIEYAGALDPASACRRALQREAGHVLCFLPGAPEIERLRREVEPRLPPGVDLFPLYGSLEASAQDAALAPTGRRKLILATNLAETSLTIDGVSQVVDTGLHKVLRLDPAVGIDRLEIERVSGDSADQRAGRAGRTGPGRVLRLWDERDELRAHRDPEIRRVDLAPPFLDVLAWGADPRTFAWFEKPDEERAREALKLLERLGAAAEGRITKLGRLLGRLPLHPRLGLVLLGSGASTVGVAACAALAEGWTPSVAKETTSCDLLPLVDRLNRAPARVRRAARQLGDAAKRLLQDDQPALPVPPGADDEVRLRRALLAGYPDRAAFRREKGSNRLLLASGYGAVLAPESGVREGAVLVAVELRAGARGPSSEARVRIAARIERDWLAATDTRVEHEIDRSSGVVRAVEREFHQALLLRERHVPADPETAALMLRDGLLERGLGRALESDLRRMRFAGIDVDVAALLLEACRGRRGWFEPDLPATLSREDRRTLDRRAPEMLRVPSGRQVRLDYREDGSVNAAVKLQELFGLADSPRVGEAGTPVTFELLAPNGRPVQTTRDLRSFWNTTYVEVRKQLRGRYPKHPWPEDPWSATPTARTKRRDRSN